MLWFRGVEQDCCPCCPCLIYQLNNSFPQLRSPFLCKYSIHMWFFKKAVLMDVCFCIERTEFVLLKNFRGCLECNSNHSIISQFIVVSRALLCARSFVAAKNKRMCMWELSELYCKHQYSAHTCIIDINPLLNTLHSNSVTLFWPSYISRNVSIPRCLTTVNYKTYFKVEVGDMAKILSLFIFWSTILLWFFLGQFCHSTPLFQILK